MNETISIDGVIHRVTYRSNDGWAVFSCEIFHEKDNIHPFVDAKGRFKITGMLPDLKVGELINATGELDLRGKHGPQIKNVIARVLTPVGAHQIEQYLRASKLVDKVRAHAIVQRFGDQTLDVLENTPEKLVEVPGVGKKTAAKLQEHHQLRKAEGELALFLSRLGLGDHILDKISKVYLRDREMSPAEVVDAIQNNPYILSRDVKFIGFKTCDEIALNMGMPEVSVFRIIGAAEHLIREATGSRGDVFQYDVELINAVVDFLKHDQITASVVQRSLQEAFANGQLVLEGNRVYEPKMLRTEERAADLLRKLLDTHIATSHDQLQQIIQQAQKRSDVPLDQTQVEAIMRSLANKVSIITGGPGTGKSTLSRALVRGLELLVHGQIELLAPTGRAAKRMTEVIGQQAYTIHRRLHALGKEGEMLGSNGGVVIVDEFSMVDIHTFVWLLSKMDPHARLIMVGDQDQLPSVGPGAVFRDLLGMDEIASTVLTKIYRQAEKSDIVVNAHAINRGIMVRPNLLSRDTWTESSRNLDFFTTYAEDAEVQANRVIWLMSKFVPMMGFDARSDVQVITPQNRGPVGVDALNGHLQRLLNPERRDAFMGGYGMEFALGDRVMQIKNNYDVGVFNGDIGTIMGVVRTEKGTVDQVVVQVNGDDYMIPHASFVTETRMAYACTVHKSQGAEYPVVIVCLHTGHYTLLQRNLLYTAVTRGRKLVVLVAHPDALGRAIKNDQITKRNSYLRQRLSTNVFQEVA